jgi:hypothetical protein
MIIVIGWYCARIALEILAVNRSSTSPGAGRKRRWGRSATPSSYDLARRQVISTINLRADSRKCA